MSSDRRGKLVWKPFQAGSRRLTTHRIYFPCFPVLVDKCSVSKTSVRRVNKSISRQAEDILRDLFPERGGQSASISPIGTGRKFSELGHYGRLVSHFFIIYICSFVTSYHVSDKL